MTSQKYLKILLRLALAVGVLHAASFVHFLIDPTFYYYRPWEFFDELAYRSPDIKARWDGPERGDLTRDHLFLYDDSQPTLVTTDADGFRSNRMPSERYPIVVAGDSAVFGSGLSDSQTLPWRIAELTGVPTFNAGRSGLFNALLRPELQEAEIVIECIAERDVFDSASFGTPEAYRPIAAHDTTRLAAVLDVPPQRYSLPFRLPRMLWRGGRDLFDVARGRHRDEQLISYHRYRGQDFDKLADRIAKKAELVGKRGAAYLFVPIPAKQTLFGENVDEGTKNVIPTIVSKLHSRGVAAVDLLPAFQQNRHRQLFLRYDTHWSGAGVDVAAQEIVREITGRWIETEESEP